MARYRIARRADSDLDDIWLSIAQRESPVAADHVLTRLYEAFVSVSLSPGIGAPRSRFGPHLRMFPVFEYLIFYRPANDGIEIARVLHGKRNITKDFF
jgi:toxin ParE1/3/4